MGSGGLDGRPQLPAIGHEADAGKAEALLTKEVSESAVHRTGINRAKRENQPVVRGETRGKCLP